MWVIFSYNFVPPLTFAKWQVSLTFINVVKVPADGAAKVWVAAAGVKCTLASMGLGANEQALGSKPKD